MQVAKIFSILVLALLAVKAQADGFFDFGTGVRYEYSDSNLNYRALYPLFIQGGYGRGQTSLLGEYLYLRNSTAIDPGINVTQSHQSIMIWLRHSFFSPNMYGFFVGGGLGTYRDRADTNFLGMDATSVGNWDPEFGLQVGWWQLVAGPVFVEADLSARFGADYNPNPVFSLDGSVGMAF